MTDEQKTQERRRFLAMLGGGAVVLPFAGLAACSSEEPEPPTIASNADDSRDTRPDPATPESENDTQASANKDAEEESAGDDGGDGGNGGNGGDGGSSGSDLPQLSEDDSQAKSLNYKHIASDVDHSRYKEGQKCSNCQLYQGSEDDDEWAGCSIFAGKAVKGTGWCTAYSARSS